MQDDTQEARARLVEALKSLRAILTRGPVQFRLPIRRCTQTADPTGTPEAPKTFPEALALDKAANAVLRALQDDKFGQLNEDIAPRSLLSEVQRFILSEPGGILDLDRLPAPPSTLRKLDTLIEDLAGKAPSGAAGRKRKRAGDKPRKPRPLTATETETIQIVGECNGNVAAAARRLGKDRKTVEESYRNGLKKLGKEAYWQSKKTKARLLTRDKRGQETISTDSERF